MRDVMLVLGGFVAAWAIFRSGTPDWVGVVAAAGLVAVVVYELVT